MAPNLTKWILILASAQMSVVGVDPALAKRDAKAEVSQASDALHTTSFNFQHLEPGAAHMLVLEVCAQEDEGTCRLLSRPGSGRTGGNVAVAGSPAFLARIGRELAARDAIGSTQRFQIALVEATTSGPRRLEGLSRGARQALEDAAKLLPYEGLVLLEVALVETDDRAVTHMSGPGGLEYRVELEMYPVVTLEGMRLEVDRFELHRQPQVGPKGGTVTPLEMLRTSFRLEPGETVVVGTSGTGDDAALVALVTAIAPSSLSP